MLDIHNHVIYAVDDGSQSLEQSVRMLKAAKEAGITEICFTPHYMEDGYKTEREVLIQKVNRIREVLINEGFDMKLYLGEEIFIFPTLAKNIEKIICINDSRYLLMEFPLVEEINYMDEVIYQLMALGKVPIIAHPERYLASSKDLSFIENILSKGALLQININSLIGHYGKDAKRIATQLLKKNMVQFVASDAHSTAGYHAINESKKVLKKLVGEEKFIELTETNPRKALNDEEIEVNLADMLEVKSGRTKKYQWLLSALIRKVG